MESFSVRMIEHLAAETSCFSWRTHSARRMAKKLSIQTSCPSPKIWLLGSWSSCSRVWSALSRYHQFLCLSRNLVFEVNRVITGEMSYVHRCHLLPRWAWKTPQINRTVLYSVKLQGPVLFQLCLMKFVNCMCTIQILFFCCFPRQWVTDRVVSVSGPSALFCRVSSGCCARARPCLRHVTKSCMLVVMSSCGAEDRQKQQAHYRCYAASLPTHLFLRWVLSKAITDLKP